MGRKFPNGLKDVFNDEECSREWKEMPERLKNRYKGMAKQHNNEGDEQIVDKKTCNGRSILALKKKSEEEANQNERMYFYIEQIVSSGCAYKTLATQKFFFIHANHFCARELPNNTLDYYPAEFAIGEFTLKDGLDKVYHEIINEKIPFGYKGLAVDISQGTHQIPPEMEGATNDFLSMGRKLKELLDIAESPFPPLFTTRKTIPVVRSLLRRMFPDHDDTIEPFLIYELEALFQVLLSEMLRNAKQTITVTVLVAERILQKDIFAYERGIECDFHRCIDSAVEYCSKSMIKRWCYTICDNICEGFDIETIPGIHFPLNQNLQNTISVANQKENSVNTLTTAMDKQCHLSTVKTSSTSSSSGPLENEKKIPDEHRERIRNANNLEASGETRPNQSWQTLTASTSVEGFAERPLRLPKTTSRAQATLQAENLLDCNPDQRFVSIGRGKQLAQSELKKHVGALGRGCTDYSKAFF